MNSATSGSATYLEFNLYWSKSIANTKCDNPFLETMRKIVLFCVLPFLQILFFEGIVKNIILIGAINTGIFIGKHVYTWIEPKEEFASPSPLSSSRSSSLYFIDRNEVLPDDVESIHSSQFSGDVADTSDVESLSEETKSQTAVMPESPRLQEDYKQPQTPPPELLSQEITSPHLSSDEERNYQAARQPHSIPSMWQPGWLYKFLRGET